MSPHQQSEHEEVSISTQIVKALLRLREELRANGSMATAFREKLNANISVNCCLAVVFVHQGGGLSR